MYLIDEAFRRSLHLLFSFDAELYSTIFLSLRISLIATFLAAILALPLGFAIGICQFKGKGLITSALNTLMAFPTVIVGLFVYSLISNRGPFGDFRLLFTPAAIGIGQFVLAAPIITAYTVSAVHSLDKRVWDTALTLGAGRLKAGIVIISEARYSVAAAVVGGFGRAIAEVGSAMILGGNIRGSTRTITTAIALETSRGEFGLAFALGLILLLIAFAANISFRKLQGR